VPIIVELKENRPGYADIEIKRWKGDTEIEIAIQRNQDQHYFAQGMQWNPEPVWHRLTNLVNTGESLQGILEPWIIDALVQQGVNAQYLLFAKSDGLTDRGVIRFVGNIFAVLHALEMDFCHGLICFGFGLFHVVAQTDHAQHASAVGYRVAV